MMRNKFQTNNSIWVIVNIKLRYFRIASHYIIRSEINGRQSYPSI